MQSRTKLSWCLALIGLLAAALLAVYGFTWWALFAVGLALVCPVVILVAWFEGDTSGPPPKRDF